MLVESGRHGVKWKLNKNGDVIGAVKGASHLTVAQILQDHDLHELMHRYIRGKHETNQ